jgi:isopentenyl-diphosphate delta-isomerase type 1
MTDQRAAFSDVAAYGRQLRTSPAARTSEERVVLLDATGRPCGTLPKRSIHHARTPLHLAFSCHVIDEDGRVLLARRAEGKRTWPSTWSNACCGHPQPGETLREAVTRRLNAELGFVPRRMGLAVPDFAYRAAMPGGIAEHELCPVVVAEVKGEPWLNPAEVDAIEWVTWDALRRRAERAPDTLSPWSVLQVARLAALAPSPLAWLDLHGETGPVPDGDVGLDSAVAVGRARHDAVGARRKGRRGTGVAEGVGTHVNGLGGRQYAVPQADPVAAVRGPVEQVLGGFLADREREAADLDPAVTQVTGEVRRLVEAGGKRLRPAFVYWGHRAAGAAHDDGVVVAAAAVELLHTFALIHDDVVDRSARRRGSPTAQVALADMHSAAGLAGDGGWFGVSGALLAGDLAFVWADELLDATPLPAAAVDRARSVFTRLRTEVIGGQYLDLRLAHVDGADEEEARRVALFKSARYTVTRPLQLGAALASRTAAADAIAPALARYGDAVGLAFQMRDDVLGLFGDPEIIGKGCLDDLREGKRTLLVLRALRLSDGDDHRFLAGALGDPDLDEKAARRCCGIVAASGALASVEALITAEHTRARQAVAGLEGPSRRALGQLADLSVRRDR